MQLEQEADPDIRRQQTMNVITMLDLSDRAALVALLTEYREKVKPGAYEELDEAVLKAISKKTGYTLDEIVDAFAPILEEQLGVRQTEALLRLMNTINETKLNILVDNFNRMQRDKAGLTPTQILNFIEMAERQGYWREGEIQRTYAFALKRGKIVLPES